MKTLHLAVICLFVALLSGCAFDPIYTVNYLIPRSEIPIDGVTVIEFQYKDNEPIRKEIRYEHYYDKSLHFGGWWKVREVGADKGNQSTTFEVIDEDMGLLSFSPSKTYWKNDKQILDLYPEIHINGKPTFYRSSEGNLHTYRIIHNPENQNETRIFNFKYKVNGFAMPTGLIERESEYRAKAEEFVRYSQAGDAESMVQITSPQIVQNYGGPETLKLSFEENIIPKFIDSEVKWKWDKAGQIGYDDDYNVGFWFQGYAGRGIGAEKEVYYFDIFVLEENNEWVIVSITKQ